MHDILSTIGPFHHHVHSYLDGAWRGLIQVHGSGLIRRICNLAPLIATWCSQPRKMAQRVDLELRAFALLDLLLLHLDFQTMRATLTSAEIPWAGVLDGLEHPIWNPLRRRLDIRYGSSSFFNATRTTCGLMWAAGQPRRGVVGFLEDSDYLWNAAGIS